jgi:hypothetical protein
MATPLAGLVELTVRMYVAKGFTGAGLLAQPSGISIAKESGRTAKKFRVRLGNWANLDFARSNGW